MWRITTIEYSSTLRLEAVNVHHPLGPAEDALAERLGHAGADLAAARHRREEAKPWLLLKVAAMSR